MSFFPLTFSVVCSRNWNPYIFYSQKMDRERYGCDFAKMCYFNNKENIDTRLLFCLSTIITRVKELWSLTDDIPMHTSKWHGWVLTYLSGKCFQRFNIPGGRNDKFNPYPKSHVTKVANLCKKVFYNNSCCIDESYEYNAKHLKYLFSDHLTVACLPMQNDFVSFIEENKEVVILYRDIDSSESVEIDFNLHQTVVSHTSDTYELRELISLQDHRGSSTGFDSVVYNRHGGEYTSWWKECRKGTALHSDEGKTVPFKVKYFDVAVFVKVKKIEADDMSLKFLKYIGGQNHVFCEHHKIPLIASHRASIAKCCGVNCKKKVTFCCGDLNCKNGLCNDCMKDLDETQKHFVSHVPSGNVNIDHPPSTDDDCVVSDDDSLPDDESIEDVLRKQRFDREQQFYLEREDRRLHAEYEDYLRNKDDNEDLNRQHEEVEDVEINEVYEDEEQNIDDFDDIMINCEDYVTCPDPSSLPLEEDTPANVIPTTNSGETGFIVVGDKNADNENELINGHVILNQACTLLSRKDKDIKPYKNQKILFRELRPQLWVIQYHCSILKQCYFLPSFGA